MALRMTGMMSGLDTESIIQELVSARRVKVDKAKKAQTKQSWQQDAWKELNTKLKNLQSKYLSKMRFSTAYSKKVTKVSNSSAVSVITGENAVNGVQSLEISKLAKTGYLTGAQINKDDSGKEIGKEFTALSTLGEIAAAKGIDIDGGTINIKTSGKSVDLNVTSDTTISDVLTQLKNAGLNASFDAKWQRFSVSARESGAANDFSITASDDKGANALKALGLQTDVSKDTATLNEYKEYAAYYVAGDKGATLVNMQGMIDADVTSRINSYLDTYKSLIASKSAAQEQINKINDKYNDPGNSLKSSDDYKKEIEEASKDLVSVDPDTKKAAEEKVAELKEKLTDAETLETQTANVAKYDAELKKIADENDGYIKVTETTDGDGKVTYSAVANSNNKLQNEVEDRYFNKAEYAYNMFKHDADGKLTVDKGEFVIDPSKLPASSSLGATKISGQDAVIYLNGAEYTNSNNSFEINGLTFTALNETKEGEAITVTTEQDTDGIYDMVKNFLKEYNALVNEMDKLYNADAAKGYEPLTDEEKEAMSDSEVEKWEKKIKDSILRRDDNLSTVNSSLQSVMAGGIEVNGKTMFLFDFGIDTMGYFNAPENEKHAYHIDGDPDDEHTSGNADKLKSMIANDPDTVVSFFTQLSNKMYTKMNDLSKSVKDYRSFGSFYDDKKMKTDYDGYTTKIADLEKKLAEFEDKWYAKFSKMETALAKMQSNMSAVTGLFGG